jgi:hypothetical protein
MMTFVKKATNGATNYAHKLSLCGLVKMAQRAEQPDENAAGAAPGK